MSEPVTTRPGAVNTLFDLRTIIGALFAVYGLVCLLWGLAFTSRAELAKSGGIHVNLWAGIGMLALSAAFIGWALARPALPTEHARPEDLGVPTPADPRDG